MIFWDHFEINDDSDGDDDDINEDDAEDELADIGAKIAKGRFATRRASAFKVKGGFGISGISGAGGFGFSSFFDRFFYHKYIVTQKWK